MANNKGLLLIVSGPSGVGKGTICRELLAKYSNIKLSISATTRKKRPNEIEGDHYYFKSREEFLTMIENNEFLEYMSLFQKNYYGTPKKHVEEQLQKGNSVILEIDYNGALKAKSVYPDAVLIFVAPPAFKDLRQRLLSRNSESEADINERIIIAKDEIVALEKFDYIIVNDVVETAVERLHAVVYAEQSKVKRNSEFIATLKEEK